MSLKGKTTETQKLRGNINRLAELRGYSAYEVAVINGFEGTEEEWLESLVGEHEPPLYVTMTGDDANGYTVDHTYEQIKAAYDSGRSVYCVYVTTVMVLGGVTPSLVAFSVTFNNTYRRAFIYADASKPPKYETLTFALEDDLSGKADVIVATDEKYFIITDDGMVYLKPEYRGAVGTQQANSSMGKYCASDMGAGKVGSKNGELPEEIIIPEMIGETPVNSLANATFGFNTAVKRVKLPSCITKIPNFCFYATTQLEAVTGTENVTEIGNSAFLQSNIRQAIFPKLAKLGTNAFSGCALLCVADIGSVDSVPGGCFSSCIRLHTVRNGGNVASVGLAAFYSTGKLKNPVFISQLESIGDYGFQYSRVNADWASMDCAYGTNATALQLNPADWWRNCQHEVCEIPIRSTFDQCDPRWAGEKIVPSQEETWAGGCTICACAHIYSAYEDLDMESPADFVAAALEQDLTLAQRPLTYKETYIKYLEAVGYTVETTNAATGNELTVGNDLQYMYDALAAGNLVILSVCIGNDAGVGHCVVVYGINENGELLVVDSDGKAQSSGVYGAYIHQMPVQNFAKSNFDFVVVKNN
jgi:hypothetical protein